jgi:uncharacterized protein (UPF0261 family)
MAGRHVLVVATLDTKGAEAAYLCERIAERGATPILVDVGVLGSPDGVAPAVTRHEVARAAGHTLEEVIATGARGSAVALMMDGLRELVPTLAERYALTGACGIGGAEGAMLASTALRALPFGIPKVVLSPILSGVREFAPFVGAEDVVLVHSVVDLQGLNSYTRAMLELTARLACVGSVAPTVDGNGRVDGLRRVGMSLNGNTTAVGTTIRQALERRGCEVVAFHSNGVGGVAMERLARSGGLDAVIDLTPNELVEEVVTGLFPVRNRLRIADHVPRVVVAGCLDFVCQPSVDRLDPRFRDRPRDLHNPEITLVRVSRQEATEIAGELVARLAGSTAPVRLIVPTNGLSLGGSPGGSFHDPEADAAFARAVVEAADGSVAVELVDAAINDDAIAAAVVEAFDALVPTEHDVSVL